MLAQELKELYCDVFVAYYNTHASHINVTGRNFHSDHEFLGVLYEDLQAQIDIIGEFLRTLGEEAPRSISEILMTAELSESAAYDADSMLSVALENQEYLLEEFRELFDLATLETDQDIANYAADRMGVHAKYIWQLKSTLA